MVLRCDQNCLWRGRTVLLCDHRGFQCVTVWSWGVTIVAYRVVDGSFYYVGIRVYGVVSRCYHRMYGVVSRCSHRMYGVVSRCDHRMYGVVSRYDHRMYGLVSRCDHKGSMGWSHDDHRGLRCGLTMNIRVYGVVSRCDHGGLRCGHTT